MDIASDLDRAKPLDPVSQFLNHGYQSGLVLIDLGGRGWYRCVFGTVGISLMESRSGSALVIVFIRQDA